MLKIDIRPSREMTALTVVAHGFAGLAVASVSQGLWVTLGSLLVIGAGATLCLRRHALLQDPEAIVSLIFYEDGSVQVGTRAGQWRECQVMPCSFVTPRLTVLNLRSGNERLARHAVLLADSLDAEDFRRLRVRLVWGSASIQCRSVDVGRR